MKKLLSPFLLVVFIVFAFSCKKDDPTPEYVGTWSDVRLSIDSLTAGYVYMAVKESYIFTKNTYELKIDVKYSDSYVTAEYYKGDLKVKDDLFTFTDNEHGISYRDANYKITGNLVITDLTNLPVEQRTFQQSFSIQDNSLLIYKFDENQNGHFDVNEYNEYLKIKSSKLSAKKIFFLEK